MRVLAVLSVVLNAGLVAFLVIGCLHETPEGAWFWAAIGGTLVFAAINVLVAGSRSRVRHAADRPSPGKHGLVLAGLPLLIGLALGGGLGWAAIVAEEAGDGSAEAAEVVGWEGRQVPTLESTTMTGEPWSLADHAGRVVVLTFWRADHQDAYGVLVHLAALRDELGLSESLDLVSVCLDETSDRAQRVLAHLDPGGPQLFEDGAGMDNAVAQALRAGKRLPSTWVIGRDGTVLESDLRAGSAVRALRGILRLDRFQGKPAPTFETTTLDGEPWSLAEQRGRVVLLDFWATWCGPCKKELPNLRALQEKHGDRDDFALVGISLDDEAADLRKFLAKDSLPWLQLFDEGKGWENPVARTYEVQGIPDTWLIDREGRVVAIDLRGAELAAAVEEALRQGT